MILATKLHFQYGCSAHPSEQDIQSIYLSGEGLEGFYPKEQVYDMLVRGEISGLIFTPILHWRK